MFKNLSEQPIAEVQKEQVAKWKEEDLLHKCVSAREGAPSFVFYEGPPTANGKPGIHHVMARTLKDSINRYKTMQGYQVKRKGGWDTHGLPVEIEVEKQLGFSGKQDIEAYGIKEFNEKCRESVFTYTNMWTEMSDRMAYMADMDHPYITLDNDYIETGWWILKKAFDMGLIYEGHKILPYCPRCGTGLASHEVAQGYKMVKVNTLTCKFKKKGTDNEYFLAWTTTPWTLASNIALTVGPDIDYVKVRMTSGDNEGNIFYVAKGLAAKVLAGDEYEVLEELKGRDMEYWEYEQLMPFCVPDKNKNAFIVTCMDYVSTEDGTGIVHTAPAFGEDDYQCGRKYNLAVLQPVDERGEYTETPWKGRFVMEDGLDVDIIKYLAEDDKIYKKEKLEHNYPHCWRCDTPLVYYAKPSWYIEMSKLKDQLVANNNTVISGHQRLAVLKDIGETEVECVVVELNDADEKALNVAMNKVSGDWDTQKLADLMDSLKELDYDLGKTGFDPPEIEQLFNAVHDKQVSEDSFDVEEELQKPTFSQPGDIWILGRHKVICGDSTIAETYTKLMDGQKANLVLTDPPYNVDVEETAGKIMNDNMSDSDFYSFLLSAYKCMYDSLADDGSIYVWHADTEGLNFRRAFKEAGFQLSGCCIWKKNSLVLGRSPYQWIHEPCLFGWKQKGKHQWYADRKQTTVWEYDKPKSSPDHPTTKSIPLMAYPIKNSTMTNGIVLDPFLGSGSTLIACCETDRVCRGIELDPKFVDVIVKRYLAWCQEKQTAEVAYVIRDGQKLTYEEAIAAMPQGGDAVE